MGITADGRRAEGMGLQVDVSQLCLLLAYCAQHCDWLVSVPVWQVRSRLAERRCCCCEVVVVVRDTCQVMTHAQRDRLG